MDDARRPPRRYPGALLGLARAAELVCSRVLRRRALPRRCRRDPASLLVHTEIHLPRGGEACGRLTLLHLSDFHLGPFLDLVDLEPLAELGRSLSPDLLLLTGDYVTHRAEDAFGLGPLLGRIAPRLGAFAVFGNHDYRERREGEIAEDLARGGVRVLRNEGCRVIDDGGRAWWVAGVEDAEEGKVVDLGRALAGRRRGEPCILLAHHPDVAPAAAERGVDLVLSGHTHGGQILLAGRPFFPARAERLSGLHRIGDTCLYVNRGLGVLVVPWRVGAPPEAARITLR